MHDLHGGPTGQLPVVSQINIPRSALTYQSKKKIASLDDNADPVTLSFRIAQSSLPLRQDGQALDLTSALHIPTFYEFNE